MSSAPSLDELQLQGARYVLEGRNVAAVGAAGCEKSTLLSLIVSVARQKLGYNAVVVLAWAGSAAQLVGGQTVSSHLRVLVGDVEMCARSAYFCVSLPTPRRRRPLQPPDSSSSTRPPPSLGGGLTASSTCLDARLFLPCNADLSAVAPILVRASCCSYPKLTTRFCLHANGIVFVDDGCQPVD